MKIGDLFIKLGLKKDGFDRGIDGAKQKTSAFGGAMKKIGGIMAGAFAISSIVNFTKRIDQAYRTQLLAETKVQQAIKSTAGIAGLSLRQLTAEAQNLQRKTIFGDEAILNGATAQILTFTNIVGDNFLRTQRLALDLSTVLGTDLQSSSIQLGKALNAPVQNLSALSRSGIQFSKEQKNLINSLAETGRLAEAQVVILDELERQYGGQAEAAAKAAGAVTQLSNAWGDLMETLGSGQSETVNNNARFITALVQAINGKIQKGFEERKTDQQKFDEEINSMTQKELLKRQKQLEKAAREALANYRIEKSEENEEGRRFYSMEYDIAKEGLEKIATLIKTSETENTETRISLYEAAELAVKDAHQAIVDFQNQKGKFAGEENAQAYIDKLKELEDAAKKAQEQLAKMQTVRIPTPELIQSKDATQVDFSPEKEFKNLGQQQFEAGAISFAPELGDMSGFVDSLSENLTDPMAYELENLNNAINQGIGQAIGSLASGLGDLASGAVLPKDFGNQLLITVGGFMQQFGQLLIAYAIAASGLEAAIANPGAWPIALAAGIALVAIGGAISGLGKKGLSGSGGGASGSHAASGYTNYNASSGGAAIADNVVFELEGNKLIGVMRNSERRSTGMR